MMRGLNRLLGAIALLSQAASTMASENTAAIITGSNSSHGSKSTPMAASFQVDILHPLPGVSYNYTTELPIVFSAKNLKKLMALKEYYHFWIGWNIASYGLVGQDKRTSNRIKDGYQMDTFNPPTELTDELIIVRTINPREWLWGPLWRGEKYELSWWVVGDFVGSECTGFTFEGSFVFNLMLANGTEPDFSKLPACPAPEAQLSISLDGVSPTTAVNSDGSSFTRLPCAIADAATPTGTTTCAVPLGRDMASSISSEAHSQAIAATQTTSEAPEPTEPDSAATNGKGLAGSVLLAHWWQDCGPSRVVDDVGIWAYDVLYVYHV